MTTLTNMKQLTQNYDLIRVASKMTPQIKKNCHDLGEERVQRALNDESEMNVFAKDVYDRLSHDVRSKIPFEGFLPLIKDNQKKLMKKKKNQKIASKKSR